MGQLGSVIYELVLWLFILRTVASFVPQLESSVVGRTVYRITEPILAPVRRILRPVSVGEMVVDLSPVVTLLVLYYLKMLF